MEPTTEKHKDSTAEEDPKNRRPDGGTARDLVADTKQPKSTLVEFPEPREQPTASYSADLRSESWERIQ